MSTCIREGVRYKRHRYDADGLCVCGAKIIWICPKCGSADREAQQPHCQNEFHRFLPELDVGNDIR